MSSIYPNDGPVRDWINVAYVVTECTWKHIDEYKSNIIGSALPEVNRRRDASCRGLQQASFRVHDLVKAKELDVDDLMDAASLFYVAAMEVAAYLEKEVRSGEIQPAALRATAENLLRVADAWQANFLAAHRAAQKAVA